MNQEFKINEKLTLKLEEGKTELYIEGLKFIECMQLLIQIPKSQIESFSSVSSIEDASELALTIEDAQIEKHQFTITPEQEFWGHCSNLQVWAENGYDPRFLHSNISFPVLKRLYELDDPIAKKIYKEEIIKRVEAGNLKNILFFAEEGYFKVFTTEEVETLINSEKFKAFKETEPDAYTVFEFFLSKSYESVGGFIFFER